MAFDLDLIKKTYSEMPGKVAAARQLLGRSLTLSEKSSIPTFRVVCPETLCQGGKDYVDFAPDRVMQDATAQMALLQFMTCGRSKVAVTFHGAL